MPPVEKPTALRVLVVVTASLITFRRAESAFAASVSALGSAISSNVAYEEFRKLYGRDSRSVADTVDYQVRQQLFEARRIKVDMHNKAGRSSWIAKVNKFADYTDDELHALRGYRRVGGRWSSTQPEAGSGAKGSGPSSFLETRRYRNDDDNVNLAESVDWRHSASKSKGYLREQGACGSCWAVAAVGALEMHAELRGQKSVPLSYEQLVDCVPNPRHCGGTGGCKGATAELAFQYVREHGIVAADAYSGGYQHGGTGVCQRSARSTATIVGFETLALNKLQPMLETLALKGPAVASVDATDWASYSSGVFDSCNRNATVNHAVLVVGYGVDRSLGKSYWLIRNSWGDQWGEDGYIRLEKHSSDEGEAGHCGVDNDPKQGVGCDGGPTAIKVCGMCGVLSDTSYPREVSVRRGSGSSAMERILSKVKKSRREHAQYSESDAE